LPLGPQQQALEQGRTANSRTPHALSLSDPRPDLGRRRWRDWRGRQGRLRHFNSVDCRSDSQGHLPFPEDVFGVEPIHPAAALDSKGMDAAIARGPR